MTNNHVLNGLSHILILNSSLMYISMKPLCPYKENYSYLPPSPSFPRGNHYLDYGGNDGNKSSKFTVCWPKHFTYIITFNAHSMHMT